jgi:hypothetical protein
MRICINCGISFISTNPKQVCCSKTCNTKKWRKLNPERARENYRRADKKRKGKNRYNSEKRKEWYQKKKVDPEWRSKINLQDRIRHKKVQDFIREYKVSLGCKDCGYKQHHVALEFDHIGKKEINVCLAKSIKQAKKEIEKCEVVCSNCHSIRTFNRLQEKREDATTT